MDASDTEIIIPTADVAILLIGPGTSVGPAVMQRCCDDDVTVLVCDWRGIPVGTLTGRSTHTLVGRRQLNQSSVPVPVRKRAWQAIVRAKICGQARTLQLLGSTGATQLMDLVPRVRSGDPANMEATAARIYWREWAPLQGFSRQPGTGSDDVNSCLDYGYAIMRGHAIRAVMSAGLNPALGVFHRGRSNGFNLADDLMEPYRPLIDWTVANLPTHDLSDPAVKRALVAASSSPFDLSGTTVPTHMSNTAQHLGAYFDDGKAGEFRCGSWTAPICPTS